MGFDMGDDVLDAWGLHFQEAILDRMRYLVPGIDGYQWIDLQMHLHKEVGSAAADNQGFHTEDPLDGLNCPEDGLVLLSLDPAIHQFVQ